MIIRTLGQVAHMLNASLSDDTYKDTKIYGVSTDSRTIKKDALYIPLVGEFFDGRIFVKECENKGAAAFLIDEDYKVNKDVTIPYIRVKDTKRALQDLARAYRDDLACKLIGTTGSNGKTTTKDLLKTILDEKYKTQKTLGNLNNEIGVPKTILSLDEDCEVAVIELGTDNFGDISLTSRIVRPDIAIITNIGDSHLEKLKSKEGILKAKMEIIEGMDEDGIFIYNIDDKTMKDHIPSYDIEQKVLSFGEDDKADFSFKASPDFDLSFSHEGHTYKVPLIGRHNIYNAATAVMVSKILGLDEDTIDQGLLKAKSSQNRNELIELDGFDILDDAYKSNPQSLLAGLETAYMLEGYCRKIVCLSDMLELGEDEEALHAKVGAEIDPKKIDYALFFGTLSRHMYESARDNFPKDRIFYFESKDALIEELKSLIIESTLVFVKGSHSMHMEEIIQDIRYFNI